MLAIARLMFVDSCNPRSVSRTLDQRWCVVRNGLPYTDPGEKLLGSLSARLSKPEQCAQKQVWR